MTERAAFHESRMYHLGVAVALLGSAIVLVALVLPRGTARWTPEAMLLVLAGTVLAGVGLWFLARLRRTGVVVTVDRDGITDLRLMPDPIPWSQVERCALITGIHGARYLHLLLRPESPAAARLGKARVIVDDLVLTGDAGGLRAAIARLAPQVPRNW